MSGRVRLLAAAAVAAAAVAGCASTVTGTPHQGAALSQPHFPTESAAASSRPVPSSSNPAPGFPSASAQRTSAASSSPTSGNLPVINDVHFTRPAGFVKRTNLEINHPVAAQYQVEYLTPGNEPANGKDALAIILYDLPAGSRPATPSAQQRFIERYDAAHNVSVTDGVRQRTIAGYPGFSVLADEPPDYHYLGYYVFGTDTLLEVTCQYDKKLHAIASACGRIVGSLQVTA